MTVGNSGMKILTNVFFQIQPTLRPGSSDAELFKLEPNLIHWIKYLKSLASERIKNVYFNLERLTHSSRLAWPGISTLDRLGTALIKMPNFCKQFDQNEHVCFYFCHLEFEPSGFETWNGVKRPCLASNGQNNLWGCFHERKKGCFAACFSGAWCKSHFLLVFLYKWIPYENITDQWMLVFRGLQQCCQFMLCLQTD